LIPQRKRRNSSRVNLTISFIFHGILILVVFVFAAREGMLGKKLKQLSVTMVPKEKKPEPPKEKPPEPKTEPPKTDQQPKVALAQPRVAPTVAPSQGAPPPAAVATMAAPPAVNLPAVDFSDGAKEVQTLSDPNAIYKALVEHTLRSHWNRPEDIPDDDYVAEVELAVDVKGKIAGSTWLTGSGDKRWDDSVKAVLAETKTVSRPPPKGFPPKFLVRFDVETSRTEPLAKLSTP
jgi:periplasmic protein TonB